MWFAEGFGNVALETQSRFTQHVGLNTPELGKVYERAIRTYGFRWDKIDEDFRDFHTKRRSKV